MKDRIELAQGGGGRASRDFIQEEIVSRFGDTLGQLPDAASLVSGSSSLVFSTDSFVVQPLVFPGGTIGDLAVYGTVNDIAVAGGRPRWLSLGLIIEEGLPVTLLRQILDSIAEGAAKTGVQIVTGDTKVVGRGQCDQIFINTAGIGEALPGFQLSPGAMRPGDAVIVSGDLAAHGFAVLAARERLSLSEGLLSDTAPVHRLVEALSGCADAVRIMRDPTRGGLAAVLNEFTAGQAAGIEIEETKIPYSAAVLGVAEMLGIDPLHVPSEGRVIAVCSAAAAATVLEQWRGLPEGQNAAVIGEVTSKAGSVSLRTSMGGTRMIDMPAGELLPRIC